MFYGPSSALDTIKESLNSNKFQWPPMSTRQREIAEIDDALTELFNQDRNDFWAK